MLLILCLSPGMLSAAASLGMILLWDVDGGLTQIDKYLYSSEDYIKVSTHTQPLTKHPALKHPAIKPPHHNLHSIQKSPKHPIHEDMSPPLSSLSLPVVGRPPGLWHSKLWGEERV